ncbi:hypothetical protein ACOM2C_00785 [Pseudarthrobacter sp. So.54]
METAIAMKQTVRWISQSLVMALIVAGGLLGITSSASAATNYGYPSISYTGVSNPPTSDKPQSKLWFTGGSWWADMWTSGTGWQIYRLDVSTKTWVSTGLTNDTRASTLSDTLWDGSHLYIASHVVTVSGDTPKASIAGQLSQAVPLQLRCGEVHPGQWLSNHHHEQQQRVDDD